MNKNLILVLLAVIGVIIVAVASQSGLQAENADATDQETVSTASSTPALALGEPLGHALLDDAPLAGDYLMGSKDAPVTLVEYASLSCSHCAHFHKDVLTKLKPDYIDSGKLRYILRQFPLNEPAIAGAMLVHCAGKSGGAERYYQFNDVLFNAQNKWAFDMDYQSSLQTFAEIGGITEEAFETCMADKEQEKAILLVRKRASDELGVSSTPQIFINGRLFEGNKSLAAVKTHIDALITQPAQSLQEPQELK